MMPRLSSAAAVAVVSLALLLFGSLVQGATRPVITIGLLQYSNPADHALNYSVGYERDAMEMLVAMRLAVSHVNSKRYSSYGIKYLADYELRLDERNSLYNAITATAMTQQLLDSAHNPAPPPIVLGFIGFDEAQAATIASQPYQTPLLTHFVSTPSLTSDYPNFNRYCTTDQLEAFAQLALWAALGWNNVAAIYNSEGGSSQQLVQALIKFGPTVSPGLDLATQSYTFALQGSSAFPDVSKQLAAIKAGGYRIILLSCFSSDVFAVLVQAQELGMIGAPYMWIGSNEWCFDSGLYTDSTYGSLLNGVLCTQDYTKRDTPYYQNFASAFTEQYNQDPSSTYFISEPTVSANAYDSVFGAAEAMQTVLDLRAACNLSASGDYTGNGAVLSDLIPPTLSEFSIGLYRPQVFNTTSSSASVSTTSAVPITYPDVCPWLMYQVGQARVLTRILREQSVTGSTGQVNMMASGDRFGDLTVFNIYGGARTDVGHVSSARILKLLASSSDIDFTDAFAALNDTSIPTIINTTAGAGGAGGNGSAPAAGSSGTSYGNSSWRASYDPVTFRPTGHYVSSVQELSLASGATLGVSVFQYLYTSSMRFVDGTSNIPLDQPVQTEVIQGTGTAAQIAVLVMACVVAAYNLYLLAFQIRYRKHKLIKATSPMMNIVFLVGSLGILIYVVILGLDSTQLGGVQRYVATCNIKYALLSISFSLAFGSLFAKTYRLDAIFNSKHLHVHVVKDRDILLMVLKLVLIDIAILLIWDSHSPLYRHLDQDTPTLNPLNYNELLVTTREFCRSPNFTLYVGVFLAYKALVLLAGLFLALRVRKINIPNLNDSKFIVVAIYQVVVIASMLIAVSIVISSSPTAFYLIVSIGLLFLVTVVLSLLYLPRVLTVCYNFNYLGEKPAAGATGANPDSKDTASSLTSDALKAEMTKLKQRITQAQAEVNEARKQMHAAGLELKLPQAPPGHPPPSPLRHPTATLGPNGSARSPPSPMLMPRNPTFNAVGGGELAPSSRPASLGLHGLAPVSSESSSVSPAVGARRVDAPTVRIHMHPNPSANTHNHHTHHHTAGSSELRSSDHRHPLDNIVELATMGSTAATSTATASAPVPSAVDIAVHSSPSAHKRPLVAAAAPSPLPGAVSGDGDVDQIASPSAARSGLPDEAAAGSAAAEEESVAQDNLIQAPAKRISP